MLSGVTGHLIAGTILEREAARVMTQHAPALAEARRRLTRWRRGTGGLGPASSIRAIAESVASPLLEAFGLSLTGWALEDDCAVGCLDDAVGRMVVVACPWGARLDRYWRPAVIEARRRDAPWALLLNGIELRVLDAQRFQSRRFLELDVDLALDDDVVFAALWSVVCGAGRGRTGIGSWMIEAVRESERHGVSVCRSLRDGVLEASGDILNAIARPAHAPVERSFEQALTIVYRILFLLFAEARGLVPLWHPVYRESYSIESLRRAADRTPAVPGLWEALRASCRLAHAGCRAGTLRVTAFNGRLFAPSGTPLADREGLDDQAARRAVLALTTRLAPDRAGRERIAYDELGVEQLGAVYESLLDYGPRRDAAMPSRPGGRGGQPAAIALVRDSDRRKSTGTFYTPQPIAQYLVKQTLAPLVRGRAPEELLALRVLDPAMGSGAFLVAACEFLAQAYEQALVESGACHPTDLTAVETRLIRRLVAERCLFGVDLNPMATQLARLSLWLASLAADRPLSFLDHHLCTGDSLLGSWVTCLSRPPLVGRRRLPHRLPLLADEDVAVALRAALPVRFSLNDTPNDTADQVREKERALAALNRRDSILSRWRRVADLWCACWFTSDPPASAFGDLTDAILTESGGLPSHTRRPLLDRAESISAARRFFHWELEFPEVFFDEDGRRLPAAGFDAVLGNPPWDMLRADSGPDAERPHRRDSDRGLLRFAREAGVYEASVAGHVNRYQLFVERAVALTKPGGRLGLVVPSGVAADHGSGALRRLLFSRCQVDTIVGFDNRRAVFPIHRSVRFLLLSAECGRPTTQTACRLGATDLQGLETLESPSDRSQFPIRVSPALLERLSGPDLALPDLRTPADLTLAERAAALFPPLGDPAGWGARFGRELNASDDRECLRPSDSRGVPVVEGRQLSPFVADLCAARWKTSAAEADARLGRRWRAPRLAYRDVASPTNRVTLIAAVMPGSCVSTHTVFCLRTPLPLGAQHFLCGLFNSFFINYLVRMRVTTHVTTALVERLPVPRADQAGTAFEEVGRLARRLSRRGQDDEFAGLNAIVARLYQLSKTELAHVLDTFPLVEAEVRDRTLAAFVGSAPPARD